MSAPHAQELTDLYGTLKTDPENGLSVTESIKRIEQYGHNELDKHTRKSRLQILVSQFSNSIVYLLAGAAAVSFAFGDNNEGIAILAVILINSLIGYILESQANRSMEALKKLDKVFAKVIRDGKIKEIESRELVPGDLLYIEAGDIVSADARLVRTAHLETNESSLTGESTPVEKNVVPLTEETVLAEQINMIFKGTAITKGNGYGIVTNTGMQTEIGQVSRMVQKADDEEIPLNKKLDAFSRRLIWLTVAIIICFIIMALIRGQNLYVTTETAIALAVAAIPEGLPIVATIALARGMLRMASYQVIVKKLAAVETLGETDIILTDKTGTLTENQLTVQRVINPVKSATISEEEEAMLTPSKDILRVAMLCNNASIEHGKELGDPVETALLKFVLMHDPEAFADSEKWERVTEKPFDSDTRMMETLHSRDGTSLCTFKGSPAEVIEKCDRILVEDKELSFTEEHREWWRAKTKEMSSSGLKVLSFGHKYDRTELQGTLDKGVFLGLIGFIDPPRVDVPEAIGECYKAGMKVVMLTGDHPETARAIALQVGLTENPQLPVVHGKDFSKYDLAGMDDELEKNQTVIFSRVTPGQKLDVISHLQKQGYVVGMTGDGVNDAPALKKSDIGIAMGIRGTQVAEEAADMILQDDSFTSIIKAIRQGRIIFKNIRNFVIYLLSSNLSEVLVVASAAFSNVALPLLPLQILFLNLITDVFPALALGMSDGSKSIMEGKVYENNEPILKKENWTSVVVYAAVLTIAVMSVYLLAIYQFGYSLGVSNNIAFFTLALTQLWNPFNLIEKRDKIHKNEIVRNPHLWLAIIFSIGLLIAAYSFAPLADLLRIETLNLNQWMMIIVASLLPIPVIRALKKVNMVW